MPSGVPNKNHIHTLDTRLAHHWPQPMIAQSSGDPPHEPQLKGYHSKPQLKEIHVFTLHLEPQLKGCHSEP